MASTEGGSAWIALFPILVLGAMALFAPQARLFSDPEYWLGVPPVVGSWIGGSTSQLVLKELSGCPEAVFLSVLVLDALLVNLWTILMFQGIRRSDALNRWLRISDSAPPPEIGEEERASANQVFTFLVVAGIVLAAQALSIFGDHSDVMSTRHTGFAMLATGSVQQVMDLAPIAHLTSIKTRIPFLHFFDGFRTSHEIQKVEAPDQDELAVLIRRGQLLATAAELFWRDGYAATGVNAIIRLSRSPSITKSASSSKSGTGGKSATFMTKMRNSRRRRRMSRVAMSMASGREPNWLRMSKIILSTDLLCRGL